MEHFMFFQIEQLMLIRCFEGEALRSKLILREYLNGVTESFQEASFFPQILLQKIELAASRSLVASAQTD